MKVRHIQLSDQAAAALRRADPPPSLYDEIRSGAVVLQEIDDGRAYAVTESFYDDAWVHALVGRGTADVIQALIDRARNGGYKRLMAETRKPGMVRLLGRYGFDVIAKSGPTWGLGLALEMGNVVE